MIIMDNKIEVIGYKQSRVDSVLSLIKGLVEDRELDLLEWLDYPDEKKLDLAIKYAGKYNVALFLHIIGLLLQNKQRNEIKYRENLRLELQKLLEHVIKTGIRIELPFKYRGLGITTKLAEICIENNYALLVSNSYQKEKLQRDFKELTVIVGRGDHRGLKIDGFVTDVEIKNEVFDDVSLYIDYKGGLL